MKGPLSAKAKREVIPVEKLPYKVTRKYGEPKLMGTINEVRSLITGDLTEIGDRASQIGTAGDVSRIGLLRERVDALATAMTSSFGPVVLQAVVDEYTGVSYHVTIEDRRRA